MRQIDSVHVFTSSVRLMSIDVHLLNQKMGISFMFLLAVALFCPDQTKARTCGSTYFSCGDIRKICIPMTWRCDGDMDCPNNADEEGCGEDFLLPQRQTPVPQGEDVPVTSKNQSVQNEVSQGEYVPVTSKNQSVQNEDDLGSTQVTPAANGSDTEKHRVPPTSITINHVMEKQYEVLTLEKTKLILLIQNLKLEKIKLKLELKNLGHGV
ncbi:hypothetical protein PO909_002010 [Leuciscus waleckii]